MAYDDIGNCRDGDNTSIRAVTIGGRPLRLPFRFPTTFDVQLDDPAWAPDGRLAYSALDGDAFFAIPMRTGASGIYASSTDGSPPQRVTKGLDEAPAWSSDGGWIVFDRGVVKPHGRLPGDIWLVRAEGTAARALTRTNADDGDPTWLPPAP